MATLTEIGAGELSANLSSTGGVTVTYTPKGGSALTPFTAEFAETTGRNQFEDVGDAAVRSATLLLPAGTVSAPGKGDTVAVAGETWKVSSVLSRDPVSVVLELHTDVMSRAVSKEHVREM